MYYVCNVIMYYVCMYVCMYVAYACTHDMLPMTVFSIFYVFSADM